MSVIDWVSRRIHGFDRLQRRRSWLGMPVAVFRKYGDDGGGRMAALIAYYGFLAIFPLLLLFVTVLGLLLHNDTTLQTDVLNSALANFPVIGEQLQKKVTSINQTGFGLAIGITGTLLGSRGVANTVQYALNTLWAVPLKDRPPFLARQLRGLGLIGIIGAAVIGTTALSALVAGIGITGIAAPVGVFALSFAFDVVLYWIGFRTATARCVPPRLMWLGAVASAVVWQVLQVAGTALVTHQLRHASALYGTFGIVLGLLAWLYLASSLMLLAIEFDVVRSYGLWPRGLDAKPSTPADHRAYELYARIQERVPDG
jgi:YihY family inner membrane protein